MNKEITERDLELIYARLVETSRAWAFRHADIPAPKEGSN